MHSLSTKIFPKTKRGGAKNGPVNVIYSNDENNKYLHIHENKECIVLHNTLLHNINILIIFLTLHNTIYMSYALPFN